MSNLITLRTELHPSGSLMILSSRQHATAVDPAGHVYEAALF